MHHEPTILLLQPPEYWDYRQGSPHQAWFYSFNQTLKRICGIASSVPQSQELSEAQSQKPLYMCNLTITLKRQATGRPQDLVRINLVSPEQQCLLCCASCCDGGVVVLRSCPGGLVSL